MTHDPFVRVRGARVHNLRSVDVAVPRDGLAAFTGVSGSGKSSLAFGTLYAEAQQRYLESVAPYARRLLQQVGAPDADAITGLPPAVALSQRRAAPSARSSVGTIALLSNSLRMLLSRAGTYPAGAERLDSDAFSPNTAAGACSNCEGMGEVLDATERSLVPDASLSIRQGAVAAWPGGWMGKNLREILEALGYDVDAPWRDLPQQARDWILFTDEQPVVTVHPVREAHRIQRPYQGTFSSAKRLVMKAYAASESEARRERAARYLTRSACPVCGGRRLRAEALAVTFAGRTMPELAGLALSELAEVLDPYARGDEGAVAVLAGDVVARIRVLERLGLGYLSVNRPAPSLSAGELQRLRLGTQLRSGLFGVVYVLDEPSAGLHPADTEALMEVLTGLKESGNSVFLVEHDMDVVRRADWVVDVGPGAGSRGGRVLYSGPVDGLAEAEASQTRPYLFAPERTAPCGRAPSGWLKLRGVHRNNLRGLDADVPLGVFTAVTGVSGAGKTSLLRELADGVEGFEGVDRVVEVDQRPIGRTPRSNPATYTGMFDAVRKLFAATEQARERGYGAGRFSFNVDGGRCATCQGEGFVSVELLFLPSSYAPCPECKGARYDPDTLRVTYRGRSIAQVLEMTVEEAVGFFADVPAAARPLRALDEVGVGYLRLGQPATELSGGEAQRIKLASELQRARRGHTLYLLDEPTTGLHPKDRDLLVARLHELVDGGATVVVAEHDMSVAAGADHVIDLGPGGGDAGGTVTGQGAPREVAESGEGRTPPFLRARLSPGAPSAL
ncbi:ATP-binding cassette domain-containing protein [Nocardiopsis chromatogenes]|uniref:ATP-binding cassette domain-containing protein n=1 Tax=Nocardiopsis chromatogenes TaxID=280239 RepID=UPI0003498711|nr:excinuclease ABC subunit UvrA [Nocardiopsis chromatogenes]